MKDLMPGQSIKEYIDDVEVFENDPFGILAGIEEQEAIQGEAWDELVKELTTNMDELKTS